jgi:hypothetical protein
MSAVLVADDEVTILRALAVRLQTFWAIPSQYWRLHRLVDKRDRP